MAYNRSFNFFFFTLKRFQVDFIFLVSRVKFCLDNALLINCIIDELFKYNGVVLI